MIADLFESADFNSEVHFFCFHPEIAFCKFDPKKENCWFEMKFGIYLDYFEYPKLDVYLISQQFTRRDLKPVAFLVHLSCYLRFFGFSAWFLKIPYFFTNNSLKFLIKWFLIYKKTCIRSTASYFISIFYVYLQTIVLILKYMCTS